MKYLIHLSIYQWRSWHFLSKIWISIRRCRFCLVPMLSCCVAPAGNLKSEFWSPTCFFGRCLLLSWVTGYFSIPQKIPLQNLKPQAHQVNFCGYMFCSYEWRNTWRCPKPFWGIPIAGLKQKISLRWMMTGGILRIWEKLHVTTTDDAIWLEVGSIFNKLVSGLPRT